MAQGLPEVAVDGLADHSGIKVLANGQLGTVVEEQQGVQHYLERVHRELELPAHGVHELEFDVFVAARIAQSYQGPPITVVVHFHHLADVRLLQAAGAYPFPADAVGKELEEGAQDGRFHLQQSQTLITYISITSCNYGTNYPERPSHFRELSKTTGRTN